MFFSKKKRVAKYFDEDFISGIDYLFLCSSFEEFRSFIKLHPVDSGDKKKRKKKELMINFDARNQARGVLSCLVEC